MTFGPKDRFPLVLLSYGCLSGSLNKSKIVTAVGHFLQGCDTAEVVSSEAPRKLVVSVPCVCDAIVVRKVLRDSFPSSDFRVLMDSN